MKLKSPTRQRLIGEPSPAELRQVINDLVEDVRALSAPVGASTPGTGVTSTPGTGVTSTPPVVLVEHFEPANVNAPDLAANTDAVRLLNRLGGPGEFATLADNKLTLPAGEYQVEGYTVMYLAAVAGTYYARAWLAKTSDDSVVAKGASARWSRSGTSGNPPSLNHTLGFSGVFTLSATTEMELRHRSSLALNPSAWAANINSIEEIYTSLRIQKLS